MRVASRTCVAAIAGLVCSSLFGAPALTAEVSPDCEPQAAYEDVVLVEGVDLCSTSPPAERELIRSLLDARSTRAAAGVIVDYPADGSIFPPEMIAPTFLWHDDDSAADRWLVDITLGAGGSHIFVLVAGDPPPRGEIDPRCVSEANEIYEPTPYQASARSWRPSAKVWETVKRHSVEQPASVTVIGYRGGDVPRVVSRGGMTFSTSRDPVGAPVFYRDVPLMPSKTKEGVIKPLSKGAVPLVAWRLRDIAQPESRLMLTGMPTCANCHSFSADGKTLAMDIDGPEGDKGAYAIVDIQPQTEIRDEQVMTWNAFPGKPQGLNTLGFLSRISPDGRHVVSTVNEQVYVQNFQDYRFSQTFYPTRGILAYYSRATGGLSALPGADDPDYVHCDPVWSPDGKTIVFARARARDPYDRRRPVARYSGDPNETQIQYDLYRMPFNDGRGGTPIPIPGASNNGMSNTFPKVSPDGKWVVFVKCKNGQLMRPDSRLWIVPFDGNGDGEAREMRANLPVMNSWHTFSPNGRWLAFSSKSNTPYTQLFLTHIDEEGRSSPALLVENSTLANRAVNLPEFVNVEYDDFAAISVPAVDHYEYFRRGNELARQGRFQAAVAQFEKALAGEAQEWRYNDWRIHENLSKSLLELGDQQGALEHIEQSLRRNPFNVEMHTNLGFIMFETGVYDRALKHLDIAVRLYPRDPLTWYNRATIHLRMENRIQALADYTEAIRLAPEYADAYNGRATARRAEGDVTGALSDLDRAIELDPALATAFWGRALIRKERGDLAGAQDDLTRAVATASPNWPPLREIEALRAQIAESLKNGG